MTQPVPQLNEQSRQRLLACLADMADFVREALERIDGLHAVMDLAEDTDEEVPAYRVVQALSPHFPPLESCITAINNFRREAQDVLGTGQPEPEVAVTIVEEDEEDDEGQGEPADGHINGFGGAVDAR